jgi:hypothetical protein
MVRTRNIRVVYSSPFKQLVVYYFKIGYERCVHYLTSYAFRNVGRLICMYLYS